MNYYCITSQSVDDQFREIILVHSAYYSRQEFHELVKEALAFIYNKIKDNDMVAKKGANELAWAVCGYLIEVHNFRWLDTDNIQSRYFFFGDYTKDDIAEVIGLKESPTIESIHKALGSPRMYTS